MAMIYRRGLVMTFSVRIILQTLIDLDAAHKPVRYRQIADHAACSEMTVRRAVKKLEAQKKLRRVVAHDGYLYEIQGEP